MSKELLQLKQSTDLLALQEGQGKVGSSTESCPLMACEMEQVLVSCSHGRRSYILDLSSPPPGKRPIHVLQVISEPENAEVIKVISQGSCAHGNPASSPLALEANQSQRPNTGGFCPVVAIGGPQLDVKQPGEVHFSTTALSVSPPERSIVTFFQDHLSLIYPPAIYKVSTGKCTGGRGRLFANVEVFPKASWRLSLSAELDKTLAVPSLNAQGFIQLDLDQHSWCIGNGCDEAEAEENGDIFNKLVQALKQMLDLFKEISEQQNSINILWPRLYLEGRMKLEEAATAYEVGKTGSLAIGFDPLIGADFTIDILPLLLRKNVGSFRRLLAKVVKKMEKGYRHRNLELNGALFINLISEGKISGKLEWHWQAGRDSWTEGEVSSGLGFGIHAGANVEGRIFIVTASAGTSISGKGEDRDSKVSMVSGVLGASYMDDEAAISGTQEFNGLTVHNVTYVRIGIDALATGGVVGWVISKVLERFPALQELARGENMEEHKQWTVLEPWVWPPANGVEAGQESATRVGDWIG